MTTRNTSISPPNTEKNTITKSLVVSSEINIQGRQYCYYLSTDEHKYKDVKEHMKSLVDILSDASDTSTVSIGAVVLVEVSVPLGM